MVKEGWQLSWQAGEALWPGRRLLVTEGRGNSDIGVADVKSVARPRVEMGKGRTHVEVGRTRLIWNLGMGINNCWAKHRRMRELLEQTRTGSSKCI